MKKKIVTFVIIILFIGIITSPISNSSNDINKNTYTLADDVQLNEQFFDKYLTLLMKIAHKPSVSACVIINDSIAWSKGYGLYDIENNKQATTDTLYLMASISKTVTATALMQLYEQGYFELDDDVNNYLPFSLRNPNHPDIPITFLMLLSHQSSLAGDNSDRLCISYLPGDPDIPSYPYPWLEEYLTPSGYAYPSEVWSTSKPGQQYTYANIGYSIIGYLVELISGQNFNEYCKEHIFIPLDMTNTSFRLRDYEDMRNIAIPYFYHNRKYEPNPHYGMILVYPAASMRTSIEELSHFLIAHMNGGIYKGVRILNESTVILMHTRHYPGNKKDSGYGLGWIIRDKLFQKKEIGHSGGWPGVHTQMNFRPEDKTGIIIFTNSYDSTQYLGPIEGFAFKLIKKALFRMADILANN
jgi:CubicO group peptidase (beta-lactamase class C family)